MNKNQINLYRFFLLSIALLLVLGACSSKSGSSVSQSEPNNTVNETPSTDETTQQKGGEAVVGYNADISNYDPLKGSSGADHSLLWPVYDTLITFNNELEPQPGLAESWEFPDDNTLILHLRDGVEFHDGAKLDAEAVKLNLERANTEGSTVSDLKNINSVEVIDPLTVKINLKQPDSSLLLSLSDRGGMMVSPTALENDIEGISQNPVGAGPYKMIKRVPNGEIVFESFENYWQEGKPLLNKLTVKIMPDENARINALRSGEVDIAVKLSPANVKSLEADPKITVDVGTSVAFFMIYFNTSMPPFDNKNARLAILHAIDREAINKAVNFGLGEPSNQAFPKGYWAAAPDLKAIDYDPEKSKELLKESGLSNISFTMIHNAFSYDENITEIIRSSLKDLGMDVKVESLETTAAAASFFAEKKIPAYMSQFTGRPDPQMTINSLYSKDSYLNPGKGSTEEIEALISKAASTYGQDERSKIYGEIGKLLIEEGLAIPISTYPDIAAVNKRLKGYEPNLYGKPIFSNFWIEE